MSPNPASSPIAIPCGTRRSRTAAKPHRPRVGDGPLRQRGPHRRRLRRLASTPSTRTTSHPHRPLNWDQGLQSPFKSDVYFFSTHQQIDQKWGTATPITVRDKEFGAVRLRGYGIYSYRLADPRTFFTQVSGTRQTYTVAELEDQLRNTIIARMTDIFSASDIAFLDMTANEAALGAKIADQVKPAFTALGLELSQFVVENISLPDELQKSLDSRIGMNMVGDIDKYTQFATAQSLSVAAANPGGTAGIGVGIGAGSRHGTGHDVVCPCGNIRRGCLGIGPAQILLAVRKINSCGRPLLSGMWEATIELPLLWRSHAPQTG